MKRDVSIIYKGDYSVEVAGVAIRYLNVARELVRANKTVCLVGKQVPENSQGIEFVSVSDFVALWKVIFNSKTLILHGGGPVILLLSAVASLLGRNVILDAYALHWLELNEVKRKDVRIRVKIIFNFWRIMWAAYFFDHIVVGTIRQKDLVRGIITSCAGIERMRDVHMITGGCQIAFDQADALTREFVYKEPGKQFVDFGWIGGVWPWFNIGTVLKSLIDANQNSSLKGRLHFFGVPDEKRAEAEALLEAISLPCQAVFFHDWVPYADRLKAWHGLDCAIVWSDNTLENDYASRTRNFDCISLGIPVIQNQDSFWANIVSQANAGIVCCPQDLEAAYKAMGDQRKRMEMGANMASLANQYCWEKVSLNYLRLAEGQAQGKNWLTLLSGVVFSPLWLVSTALNLLASRK